MSVPWHFGYRLVVRTYERSAPGLPDLRGHLTVALPPSLSLVPKKLIIVAVVLILIIAAASFYFLRSSSNDQVIATSDVREISSEGIVARVSVNGNIEAARTTTIYTSLTVPVANLPVAVGDRVAADQVLAELDASVLQRQLDETDANNARAAMANRNSIAQSQQAYEQSRELLDSGLSPEINSAQSSLRASSQAYQDAIRSFEAKQRDVDGGLDSTMVAQSDALKAAREQADAAEIERLRADFGLLNNDRSNLNDVIGLLDERESLASAESELAQARAAGDLEAVAAAEAKVAGLEQSIASKTSTWPSQDQTYLQSYTALEEAERRVASTTDALEKAERIYIDSLGKVDSELAAAQRAVAEAHSAQQDAALGLETAQLSTQHQLEAQSSAIDAALGLASVDNEAATRSTSQLRMDINNTTVRSPYSGIVSSVQAAQGQPAAGALLSVADDSDLKITANVKEAEISNVTVGSRVTFTTPSTGTKEFAGRVSKVSPIAAAASAPAAGEGAAAGAAATNTDVTFPIEISVTGDREGLNLGGSARVRIVHEIAPHVLTVPLEAVYKNDDGKDAVLIISDDNKVEEVEVKTAESDDFDIAVSGAGISEDSRVLTQPGNYRGLIGETVKLHADTVEQAAAPFSPAAPFDPAAPAVSAKQTVGQVI